MLNITLSELYRLLKSKSKVVTLFLMIFIIVLLSLISFNNMSYEGGTAMIRFMNNAVGITEAKLSEFFRLTFESGIFTFFTGITFIIFRARLYETKNINNIIIESKSKKDIIISAFVFTFIFVLFEFIILFVSLLVLNTLFCFENNLYETILYLSKQLLCQYVYLMMLDVIIDVTQSNLWGFIFHFAMSSGLAYSIIGVVGEKIGKYEFYKLCLSYNFLMLDNIEVSVISIICICYLLISAICKYMRFCKIGEFK